MRLGLVTCCLQRTTLPITYRGDVLPLLEEEWDLVVAHPPCTHLAASGARHFAAKRADGRQQAAVTFFM